MDHVSIVNKMRELSQKINSTSKPWTSSMSDREVKILETFRNGQFGCKTENVRKFAAAFTGFNFKGPKFAFEPGTIVVPMKERTYHGYPVMKPTCILHGNMGWNVRDTSIGNDLPTDPKEIRLATPEEIEAFYARILQSKRQTERFAGKVKKYITEPKT